MFSVRLEVKPGAHPHWNSAAIFSPNHIYYPTICFGVHRIGAAITYVLPFISKRAALIHFIITSCPCGLNCSAANPAFSAEELQLQLETTKAKILFVHPSALQTGLAAAKAVGLSDDRVVLIDPAPDGKQPFATLDEVILEGMQQPNRFVDRKLRPGEAKTKIAVSAASVHPCIKAIDKSPVVLQLIIWDDRETQGTVSCSISCFSVDTLYSLLRSLTTRLSRISCKWRG